MSGQTPSRYLEFTNAGRTEFKLKEAIQDLFDKANKKWKGVFEQNSKIALSPSHLSICVASLQSVKLFNSNLEVVDDAFEYLMSKSSKGEKGQFKMNQQAQSLTQKVKEAEKEIEKAKDEIAFESGFRKFFFWATPVLLLAQAVVSVLLLMK